MRLLIVIFFLAPCLLCSLSPKKGLVIPSWPRHLAFDWQSFSTVSWWYNYHTYEDVEDISPWWCTYSTGGRPQGENRTACFPADSDVSFYPQVYGIPGYGRWGNHSDPDPADHHQVILGWNEPNQAEQAAIPPEVAAIAWMEHQEKYWNKTLVGPAVGHADTDWFDAFMEACQLLGCRIDYLACHFYTTTPHNLMIILRDFSQRYGGRKIWFTEFAKAKEHDEEKVVDFIKELLPLLENADYIWRYSWFITRYYPEYDDSNPWFWIDPINGLLEQDNPRLTAVGEAYDHPWHLELYKPNMSAYQ